MWARIKAIFRSLFGFAIRSAENPELLLKQYIDDMQARIPQFNAKVAYVVKNEKILEIKLEWLMDAITELTPKVESAVRLGVDKKEIAIVLISQLKSLEEEKDNVVIWLAKAKESSERALKNRDIYESNTRSKINHAKLQLSRNRQAEIEEQMAATMISFEVGDETDILDRVTETIDEKVAHAEAKQEVMSETLGGQMEEIEQEVARVKAEDSYLEYQKQVGLVDETETTTRTMEAATSEQESELN